MKPQHLAPMGVFPMLRLPAPLSPRRAPQALYLRVPCNARRRRIPAPNTYNLQGSFINKFDFNTGVSRVFRLPVAVQLDGPKHTTPAPNQYDVCFGGSERNSSVAGHYEVKDNLIQRGPMVALSPFRSKTCRIPAPMDNCFPGPGAYSPHQAPAPVKRTILPRGHYLALSTPALIVPKDPPLPGPGQYDIIKCYSPSKHPMSAAFASRTERIPKDSQGNLSPGPGFYEPQVLSKQSFFYSDTKIWVPT
ncbi:hypothetical protein LDENG_00070010 [Lucifuga dentata]|nr:hypothetical protein LDENG_00070010 [Lucifuga dentata]